MGDRKVREEAHPRFPLHLPKTIAIKWPIRRLLHEKLQKKAKTIKLRGASAGHDAVLKRRKWLLHSLSFGDKPMIRLQRVRDHWHVS